MPRAHRVFASGQIWHITHRCHERSFLLKFGVDRRRWCHWLFEARKRYSLCVLDYIVTSNHIHLLVKDRGTGEIAKSMQLVAARTAQEYNLRKGRKGAFWQDRYHATAVQSDHHMIRCLVYIDLNMVRAGVTEHPAAWRESGYHEIQTPRQRYRIVELDELAELVGARSYDELSSWHRSWIENAVSNCRIEREPVWSESVAVGDEGYLRQVKKALGPRAVHRSIQSDSEFDCLRDSSVSYEPSIGEESAV